MAAEYMHIGIPVLNKKEGMTYNEDMKFWSAGWMTMILRLST